jgi:hypothetical protein
MSFITPPTLAQRIERPLRAVIDRKYADEFAEARHWPQFAKLLGSPARLANLAEVIAGMLHADCNAGKFHSRRPSDEELGAWVASKWADIRPQAIIAGTCGGE